MSSDQRSERGFTIIELLIVVMIIGILAAIAIPNLLTGMQRAKQKRTMADMRSIATAWEARAVDHNRYNAAGYSTLGNVVSQTQIETLVSPTYLRDVPNRDGWGRLWILTMDQPIASATRAQRYQVVSLGRDGLPNSTSTGATTDFDCDVVYENGAFTVYPDGVQVQ